VISRPMLYKQFGVTLVLLFGLNGCASTHPVIATIANGESRGARPSAAPKVRALSPWITAIEPYAATEVPTLIPDAVVPVPLSMQQLPGTSPPIPFSLPPLETVTALATIKTRSLSHQPAHQLPTAVPGQLRKPTQPATTPLLSEQEFLAEYARISIEMVSASRVEYRRERGFCACPEDLHFDGQLCGERSGYHGPKHAQPLCYTSDVTPQMAADYKRTNSLIFSVR
jgi:hypothetical protein